MIRDVIPHLLRFAVTLTSVDDAPDLVQDTLVQAWAKRHQYDPTRGSLRAWTMAIVADRARAHPSHSHERTNRHRNNHRLADNIHDRPPSGPKALPREILDGRGCARRCCAGGLDHAVGSETLATSRPRQTYGCPDWAQDVRQLVGDVPLHWEDHRDLAHVDHRRRLETTAFTGRPSCGSKPQSTSNPEP